MPLHGLKISPTCFICDEHDELIENKNEMDTLHVSNWQFMQAIKLHMTRIKHNIIPKFEHYENDVEFDFFLFCEIPDFVDCQYFV